ncbi:MAG: hypothetical protein WA956_13210 [Stenotrophomonas sp.]
MFEHLENASMPSSCDHDAVLLEGLFHLILNGETAGSEFEKIETEIYSRLREAYAA